MCSHAEGRVAMEEAEVGRQYTATQCSCKFLCTIVNSNIKVPVK